MIVGNVGLTHFEPILSALARPQSSLDEQSLYTSYRSSFPAILKFFAEGEQLLPAVDSCS